MSIFNKIHFPEIDPLGGGLAEEIAAEQKSDERITLEETQNGNELAERWQEIADQAHDGSNDYYEN